MNTSKHINPKDCLSCGRCCKSFSIVYMKSLEKTDPIIFSEVQRFKDLDNNRIFVTEESDRFLVTFDFKCKHLEVVNKEFRCKIYEKNRPELCRAYPFPETTNCPGYEIVLPILCNTHCRDSFILKLLTGSFF